MTERPRIFDGQRIVVPLQPLRLPAGWTIRHNSFMQVEPAQLTYDEKCYVLHEDLLLLQSDARRGAIDLGWYGDFERGQYRLNWHNVVEGQINLDRVERDFFSASTAEIVERLERWVE